MHVPERFCFFECDNPYSANRKDYHTQQINFALRYKNYHTQQITHCVDPERIHACSRAHSAGEFLNYLFRRQTKIALRQEYFMQIFL